MFKHVYACQSATLTTFLLSRDTGSGPHKVAGLSPIIRKISLVETTAPFIELIRVNDDGSRKLGYCSGVAPRGGLSHVDSASSIAMEAKKRRQGSSSCSGLDGVTP